MCDNLQSSVKNACEPFTEHFCDPDPITAICHCGTRNEVPPSILWQATTWRSTLYHGLRLPNMVQNKYSQHESCHAGSHTRLRTLILCAIKTMTFSAPRTLLILTLILILCLYSWVYVWFTVQNCCYAFSKCLIFWIRYIVVFFCWVYLFPLVHDLRNSG